MKFTIDAAILAEHLTTAQNAVEKESHTPILTHVLLTVENGRLFIRGTSETTEVETSVEVEKTEDGQCTTTCHKLVSILKMMDGTVDAGEESDVMVKFSNGRNKCKLRTMNPDEYSKLEYNEEHIVSWKLRTADLVRDFDRTRRAMAQNDTRYYLNGLLIRYGGGQIEFVSTDGHRLSWTRTMVESGPEEQTQGIVKNSEVAKIGRFLRTAGEETIVSIGKRAITFESERQKITSCLLDGTYPKVEKAVPTEEKAIAEIECDREVLIKTLNRLSVVSVERLGVVTLAVSDNMLRAVTETPDDEEAREEVEADIVRGEFGKISFNLWYLNTMLESVSEFDRVRLLPTGEKTAMLILPGGDARNETYRGVLMPIRQ